MFSDPCSCCIQKSREAVGTRLRQNRAGTEPDSDIVRVLTGEVVHTHLTSGVKTRQPKQANLE